MANPRVADRIRSAIKVAADNLNQTAALVKGDHEGPSPGDLYVFDAGEEVGVEWLVVRSHPDDPELILLAPTDNFPLVGTPDLIVPLEIIGRPMAVRCGETDWFPNTLFNPRLRVGTISGDAVALVKRRLAEFARGRPLTSSATTSDLDPEYEDWIADIAQARVALLARSERVHPKSLHTIPFASNEIQ